MENREVVLEIVWATEHRSQTIPKYVYFSLQTLSETNPWTKTREENTSINYRSN